MDHQVFSHNRAMKPTNPLPDRSEDDRGAALLMALAFMVALGIVISAVATFATGAFTTSINLGQQRSLEANAESAATIAIANERYQFDHGIPLAGGKPYNCMPGTNQIYPATTGTAGRMTVFCDIVAQSQGSANSRELEFTACPVSSSATSPPSSCSQVELYALVTYDDVPPNASGSADTCGATTPNTCGIAMTVLTWDVRTADN
jgi:hypothetical protein